MKIKSEEILGQAVNHHIWQARKGHGSFLTFDMGEKISHKKRDGSISITGGIHLWIYLCDWEIKKDGKTIAYCEDVENKIKEIVSIFENKVIISIDIINVDTVEILFSDNLSLILYGNDKAYGLDDFFILYTPSGNISYNKKVGYEVDLNGLSL